MPAYLIVCREEPVRDEAAFAEYQRLNREGQRGEHNIVPRVLYGAVHPLEGQAPDAVVILEFPTVEEARAWYNSPSYQAALPHRLKAAAYRTIIVEGL